MSHSSSENALSNFRVKAGGRDVRLVVPAQMWAGDALRWRFHTEHVATTRAKNCRSARYRVAVAIRGYRLANTHYVGATPDSGRASSVLTLPAIRLFCIKREGTAMVEQWFPYIGHPEGASRVAWFRVIDGMGYRTGGKPGGGPASPSFAIRDGWAYPTVSAPGDSPTFEMVGSFVYAPEGAAWFRIEPATD